MGFNILLAVKASRFLSSSMASSVFKNAVDKGGDIFNDEDSTFFPMSLLRVYFQVLTDG